MLTDADITNLRTIIWIAFPRLPHETWRQTAEELNLKLYNLRAELAQQRKPQQ